MKNSHQHMKLTGQLTEAELVGTSTVGFALRSISAQFCLTEICYAAITCANLADMNMTAEI